MKGLSIVKQVRCSFSADQWGLYTTTKDCTFAARDLNRCIETYFNQGLTYNEVYDKTYEVMKKHSSYGAADSEPMYFLEDVLNHLYA